MADRLHAYMQKIQDLKIQLDDIISATNNFNEKNHIGNGGPWCVYKGELSLSEGRRMVAIKRLDLEPRDEDRELEFLKEIKTHSWYKHENLFSLLGFCCENNEMIVVYEHASRGSLDHHLNSSHLTWTQRLKICLGSAKGLRDRHDPKDTYQRLVHCDIKSANILLDDQWNAKVSDFGLLMMWSIHNVLTPAIGTAVYRDPAYERTHTLTKELDVYCFGVVLFEVLCGTLCCTYSNGCVQQNLLPTWIESYKNKKLNDIIFTNPTIQPLDQITLEVFSDIAYRCLNESREHRPNMAEVVAEIEAALAIQELPKFQKFCEWKEPISYYENIVKAAKPPLNYRNAAKLLYLLSKGVLLSWGNTWFSLNEKGEHYEMISCRDSVYPTISKSLKQSSGYNSRFALGTYHSKTGVFNTSFTAEFLLPDITYTVNLVFGCWFGSQVGKCPLIALKYRLYGDMENSTSYLAYQREDGWWGVELYQVTSQRSVSLDIQFEGFDIEFPEIEVEGIEFRPLEKEDPISDGDAYANWEGKMPIDYEDTIKLSKNRKQFKTKMDVYSTLCKGFLINDSQWFSLDKNGRKCYMLSATEACKKGETHRWRSLPKSRFGEVVKVMGWKFQIIKEINCQLVPSQMYATYLVYKLPRDQSNYEAPIKLPRDRFNYEAPIEVRDENESDSNYNRYIYLASPQTPTIKPMFGENTHNPLNKPKIKVTPEQRDDGWMEVQIWEFQTATTSDMICMSLEVNLYGNTDFKGLIIEGIEFRPL